LNNLYRAACFFQDIERYRAFCAQYAVMRYIDDRVDGFAARRDVAHGDGSMSERAVLRAWHQAVHACLAESEPAAWTGAGLETPDAAPMLTSLAQAFRRFPAPPGLWDDFFAAMDRDLRCRRFATYEAFLKYAAGATVAPTTIFLHLIVGLPSVDRTVYRPPPSFDILTCGRALGRFAYLGHILRDLGEDLDVGEKGLLYLATDDMAAHGVSEVTMRRDRQAGHTSPPLRSLVRTLIDRARSDCAQGMAMLDPVLGGLASDQRLVLGLIIQVYQAVLDKIEACGHEVMTEQHRVTPLEKRRLVDRVARWAAGGVALSAARDRSQTGNDTPGELRRRRTE
jgi:phytoene synthase